MKFFTKRVIKKCLKFKGGRSRPDKSFPFIIPLLKNLDSSKILDVGCGRGSAGLIITQEFGKKFIIDGLEVYRPYLTDFPKCYNKLITENFTEKYKELEKYDIYLFIDIIEHFEKNMAIKIMKYFKNSKIIASIPNAEKHWHQEETFEVNKFEKHLHDWTNNEVKNELGLKLIGENDAIGVFCNF